MENLQNLWIAGCILLSLIVLIMWWVLARTNEDNDSLFKDYEKEVESNKELSLQIQNLIENTNEEILSKTNLIAEKNQELSIKTIVIENQLEEINNLKIKLSQQITTNEKHEEFVRNVINLNNTRRKIQEGENALKEDFVKDLPEEQTNDNVFIKYVNDKIKKRKVSKELGKKLWEILK